MSAITDDKNFSSVIDNAQGVEDTFLGHIGVLKIQCFPS